MTSYMRQHGSPNILYDGKESNQVYSTVVLWIKVKKILLFLQMWGLDFQHFHKSSNFVRKKPYMF